MHRLEAKRANKTLDRLYKAENNKIMQRILKTINNKTINKDKKQGATNTHTKKHCTAVIKKQPAKLLISC